MSTHDDPAQRAHFKASSDAIEVRDEDDDGLIRIRMPVSSTAEARDGEAFTRERVAGFRDQIESGDIGVFLDHGRSGITPARYSALGKVGYWADPELVERGGATDLVADAVLLDPADIDADVGELRQALATLQAQAEAGVPLASSVGWDEDTGDRDVPGGADLLEISIVGIPADPRTTTASADEATMARAVSAAAEGFDPVEFIRQLRQAEGVDTVQEPEYDEAANPDGVAWDGLDLENFEAVTDDPSPQDPVVYNKFLYSETGFPPAEEASFDSLGFEVVDVDGTLLLQALEDALDALPAADVADDEREAMQEVIVQLAATEFPDAELADAVTAGDLQPASPVEVDGDDDDDERQVITVDGEDIDITPPDYMVEAAEAGAAAENDPDVDGDCGTGVGDRRADQIISRDFGREVLREIASYLVSHEEDVTAEGHPRSWTTEELSDCGNRQYAKWGGVGDGRSMEWAMQKVNEVDRAAGNDLTYPEINSTTTHNLDDPAFGEGDAVMWTWQDEPVHGRVAGIHEQYTPPEADEPITGEDGEAVYSIYEWDADREAFDHVNGEPNVAKPQSSLDESTADIPTVSEETLRMSDTTRAPEDVDFPEIAEFVASHLEGADPQDVVALTDQYDYVGAVDTRELATLVGAVVDQSTGDVLDALEDMMSDSNTDDAPDGESGTDSDEQREERDMEEMMARLLEMQEEQLELLREHGDGMDEESDDDEAEDDEMDEASTDDADDERTVTLNGEERSPEDALAELREQAADAEAADPETTERSTDEETETDTDDTNSGFGLSAVQEEA